MKGFCGKQAHQILLDSVGNPMSRQAKFGLYQLRDKRTGDLFPTYYTRRDVPKDVRSILGKAAFVASTGETRETEAVRVAERRWTEWGLEIAEARRSAGRGLASVESVVSALETWRRDRCGKAAGLPAPPTLQESMETAKRLQVTPQVVRAVAARLSGPVAMNRVAAPPSVDRSAAKWAQAYFAVRPDASDKPDMPFQVGLLLGRLQVAAREPEGWRGVPDFDSSLDAAYGAGVALERAPETLLAWMAAGIPESAPDAPEIPTGVRVGLRQRFAGIWLEVVQHLEAERQRAASYLASMDAATADPAMIRVQPGRNAHVFREDDKTLGEVIDLFRAERVARHGEESTDRKYNHLFRAIEETLGRNTPIRAITREDVGKVRDLLAKVPSNASKFYPKATLVEAVALGAKDGRKPMATNTLKTYLSNLGAVFNYAVAQEWVDKNPARGAAPAKRNSVKRRGFAKDELEVLFGSLVAERRADDARFWVPALLLFTGMRANEACQLRVSDVKEFGGVAYLDLSEFDDQGVRVQGKRLKTEQSARCVPLHPQITDAGFLEFVRRRREAGVDRLFPELKESKAGNYSHELSKWFGRHMDSIGLTAPSLVLHSMRHGFRDAGRRRVDPEIVDALGGWKTPGVGAGYGQVAGSEQVAENLEELKKMNIGFGFVFASADPVS
jgi:integrase